MVTFVFWPTVLFDLIDYALYMVPGVGVYPNEGVIPLLAIKLSIGSKA